MPIYTYCCKNNHTSDEMTSYTTREEPQVCPECGEPSLYKLTFCTNFKYPTDWGTIASERKSWNLRENHRKGTNGRSYA